MTEIYTVSSAADGVVTILAYDEKTDLAAGESQPIEVINYACSKCSKSYKGLRCLKKHFKICGQEKTGVRNPRKRKSDEESTPSPKKKISTVVAKEEDVEPEHLESGEDDTEILAVEVLSEDALQADVDEDSLCYCCDEPLSNNHMGAVRCKFCKKAFTSSMAREKHMTNLHNSNEDHPCPKCNARCVSAEILQQHLAHHTEYVCRNCGAEFQRRYHLDRHQNNTKCSTSEKPHTCDVCGKGFTRIDNLRVHLRSHLGQGQEKAQKCKICDKAIKGAMSLHIRSHTGERPFPCDLCSKVFISNGALRKHRRIHTGERPYECSYCQAKFTAKETLNRHLKVHTGDKNYKCEECGISFIQNSQLKSHMFHHTGENGHQCPYCEENFDHKPTLARHVDTVHDSAKKCLACNMPFINDTDLKAHQDSVHKDKKYVCEECCLEFENKADLSEHIQNNCSAGDEKRITKLSCGECGKTFKRYDLLVKHERAGHAPAETARKERGRRKKTTEVDIIVEAESDDEPEPSKDEVINQIKQTVEATFHSDGSDSIARKPVKYTSEKSLQKVSQKILMGFLNADLLRKVGWPWRGVVGTLERVLQVIGVEFKDDDNAAAGGGDSDRLRNMMLALLGKFIDTDHLESITNNYTVDQILRYMEQSVEQMKRAAT